MNETLNDLNETLNDSMLIESWPVFNLHVRRQQYAGGEGLST